MTFSIEISFVRCAASMLAIVPLVLGSCATTGGGTDAKPNSVNPEEVRATITKLVKEQYEARDRMDVDAWFAGHAPDVVWMSGDPSGAMLIGRDAVMNSYRSGFADFKQRGGRFKTHSNGLKIGVSPDGRAAWVADDVVVEGDAEGKMDKWRFRHTEVLGEKDGKWWVMAEFWSQPVWNGTALEIAANSPMEPFKDVGQTVGHGAQPVVAAIDQFVANPKVMLAQLADRDDVAILGADPNERAQGATDARKLIEAMIGGDAKVARKGVRAAMTPNGQVAFAAYNLEAGAEYNNSTVVLPYQVMEVFVSVGGAWKVVQLHAAHCASQELAERYPPPIPDTPAGRALRAYLDALKSGDAAQIEAYHKKYDHVGKPADTLAFSKMTGGFDFIGLDKSEPLEIGFRVKERLSQRTAAGRLKVKDANSSEVAMIRLLLAPPGRTAEDLDVKVDAATRSRVIDGIVAKLTELYVFPDTATKMAVSLRERQKKGEYDKFDEGTAFAGELTEHLQAISHDKHLRVDCVPFVLPKDEPPEERKNDPQRRAQLQQMNCGFEKVERLDSKIGYVKFNIFGEPEICGEKVTEIMKSLDGVGAIIFDVRDNHGGESEMIAFISSYLFKARTHLNDMWERKGNKTTESWTRPDVPGRKFIDQPVYVLTSNRTFSAAEEFTYNLKNLKRATIVGETTGGGAHQTWRHRLDDHFSIGVPFARSINPITKTNWEGTGVEPDVKVPADKALDEAKKMAIEQIKKRKK